MNTIRTTSVAVGLAISLGFFVFSPAKTLFSYMPGDLRDAPNSTSAFEQLGDAGSIDIPVPKPYPADPSAPVPAPLPFSAALPTGQGTVILVHGFNPTSSELDPLENELEHRGYKVVRFTYDYKQALEISADEFTQFVLRLSAETTGGNLTVIAHSMGGLVSRRAMTAGRRQSLAGTATPVKLITIASPFGGFASANATLLWPFNTFGINESFRSLGTMRDFIRTPGALGQNISHIKIETDEREKTRTQNGMTVSDALVLPENQKNNAVDSDPGLKAKITLNAGHMGVLSTGSAVSGQLLEALDRYLP